MGTTNLVVEYLVSGILVLLATVLLIFSVFPIDFLAVSQGFDRVKEMLAANEVIVALTFTAIVYAVGVISENGGRVVFEGWFDRIKERKLRKCIEGNADLFCDDPLLRPLYGTLPSKKKEKRELFSSTVGGMRYYIMANEPTLYAEVETQLNRVRLIRVTVFVELLILWPSIRLSQIYPGVSWFVLTCWSVIFLSNLIAIRSRFLRYCRSIERAYKTLALARQADAEKDKKNKQVGQFITVTPQGLISITDDAVCAAAGSVICPYGNYSQRRGFAPHAHRIGYS